MPLTYASDFQVDFLELGGMAMGVGPSRCAEYSWSVADAGPVVLCPPSSAMMKRMKGAVERRNWFTEKKKKKTKIGRDEKRRKEHSG